MAITPELPPLPDESRYDAAVTTVDARFRKNGGSREYINQNLSKISQSQRRYQNFFGSVGELASIIAPMDRSTNAPVDDDLGSFQAFMRGTAAGLMIVEEAHSGVVQPGNVLTKISVTEPYDQSDMFEVHHAMSSQIRDLGQRGMALAGVHAVDVVETWENQVIDNVERQYMFRIGVGVVALGAYRFHEHLIVERRAMDQENFQNEVAGVHDFDWDNGLDNLLRGGF